jgi:hypothetical protein
MIDTALRWIEQQHHRARNFVVILDRQAEPDPVALLFSNDVVQDYVELYRNTEISDMVDMSPWLISPTNNDCTRLQQLLENPHWNWGWLASTEHSDLSDLGKHWRDRMLIDEEGRRSLYRFQDNRVIARHLLALSSHQLPALLGPINSALVWSGSTWHDIDNPAPALHPVPTSAAWLQLPEPGEITSAIQRHNLKLWLWQQHSTATAHLAEIRSIDEWLDERLRLAKSWGWESNKCLKFLLARHLSTAQAEHPEWQPRANETELEHYARCVHTFPEAAIT